jgi:hypothetical protein
MPSKGRRVGNSFSRVLAFVVILAAGTLSSLLVVEHLSHGSPSSREVIPPDTVLVIRPARPYEPNSTHWRPTRGEAGGRERYSGHLSRPSGGSTLPGSSKSHSWYSCRLLKGSTFQTARPTRTSLAASNHDPQPVGNPGPGDRFRFRCSTKDCQPASWTVPNGEGFSRSCNTSGS